MEKHIIKRTEEGYEFVKTDYDSILTLLGELESRSMTGNAALDRIGGLLKQIEGEEEKVKSSEKQLISMREVVMRCLDRNLKAGINAKTIQQVYGEKEASKEPGDECNPLMKDVGNAEMQDGPWAVALGISCEVHELEKLMSTATPEESQKSWYLSRKLDGVRCIVQVTFNVLGGVKTPLKVEQIDTVSRTGRPFYSLDVLRKELVTLLSESPSIVMLLEKEYEQRIQSTSSRPTTLRIYLDGEVCSLTPEQGCQGGFKEDFTGIVGVIRRHSYTVPKPAYFPFDVLNEAEFRNWQHGSRRDQSQPFYLRKKRVDSLVDYCQAKGSVIVRRLDQLQVQNFKQVEDAIEEAAQKGWEGLIFRKGDKYVGKRT